MAQLKEDEWPEDQEPTTQEQEVARDPINGSKDPHDNRKPHTGTRLREKDAKETAQPPTTNHPLPTANPTS